MVMPLVQKKNPQGLRIDPEDCTRFLSSPLPQPEERRSILRAGLLAHGSSYSPAFPSEA